MKKFKFIQIINAHEHKREYNNNYYRDSNYKKINVIKMFKEQHLNYYNLIIMFFFQNCENYIASIFHIDFQINNKKIY